MGDRLSIRVARVVGEAGELSGQVEAAEAQGADASAADADPPHLLALGSQPAVERESPPENLGVERPRKPAVAHHRDHGDRADLALLQQRQTAHRRARTRGSGHQLEHPVGIRAHVLDARLRTSELGSRDELQRTRDLARVADRPDPAPDVLE